MQSSHSININRFNLHVMGKKIEKEIQEIAALPTKSAENYKQLGLYHAFTLRYLGLLAHRCNNRDAALAFINQPL